MHALAQLPVPHRLLPLRRRIPDAVLVRLHLRGAVLRLNNKFGHQWVDRTLNVLQAYIERTMPEVAGLVSFIHRAERAYSGFAGSVKKQAARRYALGGT